MAGALPRYPAVIAMIVSASCSANGPARGSPTTDLPDAGGDAQGVPPDAGDADPGPGPGPGSIDAGSPDGGTGGNPDGGTGGNPDLAAICGAAPVTFDDWETCYQKRHCNFEVGCVPENPYRDVQECIDSGDAVEGGRLSAERRERERAVNEHRAAINVDAFTRCLIDTSAAHCNTTQFNVSCALRYTGTLGDGATCNASVECASPGAECISDCTDACCTGTCQPKFKLGQACTQFSSCEPGLECHRVCLAGDVNSPCTSDRDCDPSTWCDVQAGICKADFAPGAACTNPLQCGGETSCVGLSVSTSTPGHCQRISHAGDPCDAFCYGNLACDGSTCQPLPGLGQSCPLVSCGGINSVCSNDVCAPRGAVGATCTDQTCLPGLFCTSELNDPTPTCAARRNEGEPCADPSHCESYLCSGNPANPGVCLPWSDTCALAGP